MNQKERMMAGLPYKAWMDGLEEERFACRKKIYEFNQLPPEQDSRIPELLKNLLGKTGENVFINHGRVIGQNQRIESGRVIQ